jgi:hypothetical protein
MHKFCLAVGAAVIVLAIMLPMPLCHALEVSIAPDHAQREVGHKVTVYLYADNAIDLISMGVKVSFDPTVFQVVDAQKYEDFDTGWVMDADGNPGGQFTLPAVEIDNVIGEVIMIGGRLMGDQTIGLSGKVLLGWIKFEAVDIGTSPLEIDLAKEHPDHPTNTFDNFVRRDGQVDEPQNVPVVFAEFCVKEDACEADANGDGSVDFFDLGELRTTFNLDCSTLPPGTPCSTDFNGDGKVDFFDLGIMRKDFNKENCLSCGP